MKKLNSIYLLLFITAFYACEDDLSQPTYTSSNPDKVEIRIVNQNNYLLKNLTLNTGSNEKTYRDIFPNHKSAYQSFYYAYPTFSLSFEINSKGFEYLDSNQTKYNKVDAGKYDAFIYDIDTILKTFTFRLEES